jgi:pseudouridine synthase
VLLLTNDGRLPNLLLRAAAGKDKLYRVVPHVRVSEAHVDRLRQGVVITTVAQRDGHAAAPLTAPTLPCKVERDGQALLITLQEGRNRQIRRMLEALGYETLALHRIRFMHIGLHGLQPGEWRPVEPDEMAGLRAVMAAA